MSPGQPTIVVLDDDPTGTQTVCDTDVLLRWGAASLRAQFESGARVFFLLTNSRALHEDEAVELARRTGAAVAEAAAGRPFLVVSRSDSTLRGHYPAEVDALADGLGEPGLPHLVVPAFLEGGRVTVGGTHFLESGGERIPVGETEFAGDPTFGFRASSLPDWIEEKSGGRIPAGGIVALTAGAPPGENASKLAALPRGSAAYADASEPAHLDALARAVHEAFAGGARFVVRSAASVIPPLAGQAPAPPWHPQRLEGGAAGLVVVGSYVERTTEQLAYLLAARPDAVHVELHAPDAASPEPGRRGRAVEAAAGTVAAGVAAGRLTVLSTSRELARGGDASSSREIGKAVASALGQAVARAAGRHRPAYVVAKGGITSSDVASDSLGAVRATVLGPARPGVPVWALDPDSLLPPPAPYVVFPGNVGGPGTLADVVAELEAARTAG